MKQAAAQKPKSEYVQLHMSAHLGNLVLFLSKEFRLFNKF